MTPGGGRGTLSGQPGRVPGRPDTGFGPGQARNQTQWSQNWARQHGWNHNGNWGHNNHWNWNNTNFVFGLFFYPGFGVGFNYGYWGFDCWPYCSYSPFFYYGLPYVYSPRVDVVEVPTYSYTQVPAYDYNNGYYMSPGQYTGLDAALNDIKSAWLNGRADLMLAHIDAGTQIQIYLNGSYAYSIPGTDYSNMARDAIARVRTVSMDFTNIEQRSDGAYTATGTQQFYDVNGNLKTVDISFTLAQNSSGQWIIVAAGSSTSA